MDQNFVNSNLFLPILILLPLTFLIVKYFKSSTERPPIPPGPYPWPIIGNVFQIGNEPHITLTQLAKTYGQLFSFKLGTQLVIVGSSREAAIEILKTHDRNLSGRYVPNTAPAKSLEVNHLSIGWVLECNDSWKALRTICRTELFSSKALEGQAFVREKMIGEMVRVISGKPFGDSVNIRDIVFATVFNMLSNVLVSIDLLSLEDEVVVKGGVHELVRTIMQGDASPDISDLFPILAGFDLQGLRKKSMELIGRFNGIWEPIVKERRDKGVSSGSKQDFLDALINNGSSDAQIFMLFQELFTAGSDTSTSAIQWTMAELIKNPEYMKRVEEELKNEIGSGVVVKESDLSRLKLLEACVKESLRLHPSGPFLLPHRAIQSCEVMNYTIPKNSQVLVNIWAIGRDPEIWEDPLVFKPERFLASGLDFKGNDFEFIPFGAGRRICPGLPMAAKHIPLILASLIHFFQWSLPYGQDARELDMKEKYGLTLSKEQPLILIPKSKI